MQARGTPADFLNPTYRNRCSQRRLDSSARDSPANTCPASTATANLMSRSPIKSLPVPSSRKGRFGLQLNAQSPWATSLHSTLRLVKVINRTACSLVHLYLAAFSVAPGGAATSRSQNNVHRETTRDLFGSHFGNVPVDEQSFARVRVSDGHFNSFIVHRSRPAQG